MPHFLSFGKVSNVEVSTQVIPVSQTFRLQSTQNTQFPSDFREDREGIILKIWSAQAYSSQMTHTPDL